MAGFRTFMRVLDRIVDTIGVYMMVAMVLIVCWQVFGRYVLHSTPSWTEEIALLLMMWFGFLSIGIGFRHRLHLSIGMLVEKFPKPLQKGFEKLADLLIAGFGVLLIIEGYKFTVLTMASTMPVTKLPAGIQYVVIPVTGALTALYGLMWLFGWKERAEA